jgi:hypothetical protein
MKWLGTSKYIIFLILLKIQNLWNLINPLIITNYENIYLTVSYDFLKFCGSNKIKVWYSNGITQKWICPFSHKLNCSLPKTFYWQFSLIKRICLGPFLPWLIPTQVVIFYFALALVESPRLRSWQNLYFKVEFFTIQITFLRSIGIYYICLVELCFIHYNPEIQSWWSKTPISQLLCWLPKFMIQPTIIKLLTNFGIYPPHTYMWFL